MSKPESTFQICKKRIHKVLNMPYSAHLCISKIFCRNISHFKSPQMNFTGKCKSKQKNYTCQLGKRLPGSSNRLVCLSVCHKVSSGYKFSGFHLKEFLLLRRRSTAYRFKYGSAVCPCQIVQPLSFCLSFFK